MENRTLPRLIALLFMIWPLLAQATTSQTSDQTALPAPLQAVGQQLGVTVIRVFKTDAPGITGYVIRNQRGRLGVIYAYKHFIFSGALLDANGTNLTSQYAAKYFPKPPYAAVAKALAGSNGLVSEGKIGAPEIYVFADPNCYYCRKLWELTRGWVANGKIRIHWVLVGFLKQSSAGRAAAILNAKDRAKALTEDEVKFDFPHEEGGIAELKPVPAKYRQILATHAAEMVKVRFQGTPGILFKDARGVWHGHDGVPDMAEFAKVLGIAN